MPLLDAFPRVILPVDDHKNSFQEDIQGLLCFHDDLPVCMGCLRVFWAIVEETGERRQSSRDRCTGTSAVLQLNIGSTQNDIAT